MTAGRYTILVEAEGFHSERRRVSVKPAHKTSPQIRLKSITMERLRQQSGPVPMIEPIQVQAKPEHLGPWVMMGLGVATLGAGVVLNGVAAKQSDEVSVAMPGPGPDQTLERFRRHRAFALTAYGVGAVLMGTGLYLRLSNDGEDATALIISPTVVFGRLVFEPALSRERAERRMGFFLVLRRRAERRTGIFSRSSLSTLRVSHRQARGDVSCPRVF